MLPPSYQVFVRPAVSVIVVIVVFAVTVSVVGQPARAGARIVVIPFISAASAGTTARLIMPVCVAVLIACSFDIWVIGRVVLIPSKRRKERLDLRPYP